MGCQADGVRAVSSVAPRLDTAAVRTVDARTEDVAAPARPVPKAPTPLAPPAPWELPDWAILAGRPGPEPLLGDRSARLDPDPGPLDLGYALLVDMGAGEAPHDDGVPTLHAEVLGRGGFSDSVLQVQWREPVSPGVLLLGCASLFREQDLSILDGLEDARFGWVVLGVQVRF